ncbi:siphovirus Gp157 family protein [Methyloceanibacter sp.]|uniref:siphovirus Gp157 family protein n=1 Tax=Methyloceanibacter sp. TaxID=1965321 RepID=UPI002D6EFBC8|nr:siphovirus Gp157 family protein [Methyloceanibacter sp.]HZP08758.1 siphovirus Gp157 family protein [Methyloceanibacter sp.]
MAGPSLSLETAKYQLLKQRLLSEYPEADDETLRDTLEGITDLHEMIAAVIRSALVDEALQTGLRTRLEEMRRRLERLEARSAKKRELALEALAESGLKRLEQPDFTAFTRAGLPGVIIVSEEAIPVAYWIRQPPKLDRQALLSDLKRGGAIPGAQLSNPKLVLSVRTK